ncbi:uncharacterized protein SPAPADRAFT_136855 [Spathaspora passalidarum NRRL Y-27907]|uniref:Ribonuclease H2 subunit B n=1 Tax=Spathaspora passalidarum (strain NRRL Y-27907 / 11-Y1) TaxID=619300 RepID=G3AK44_SPAPN|nr:uncharacterized protein SPAPADRAFT_136855 [Spathaspora passalidarum NRRL Y-27907]EGW32856.1 hypothetical protein SPAPADRAFT_136855 [Spathaspora passalidarum NRRL Y-27907]
MHIDKDSRVILLPETESPAEFKILELPTSNNLSTTKSYLFDATTNSLYELNEIRTSESAKLKSGDAVKSYILESDTSGAIIQSPRTIISSKFNLVYLLISILSSQKEDRFITVDDFMDRVAWSHNLPESVISNALVQICDELDQGDAKFYKFSLDKSIQFVNEKITKLVEFFTNEKNTVIEKVRAELNDPTSTEVVSQQLVSELTLQYAIDYVCGSYIAEPTFKQDLIKKYQYKFDNVDAYLAKLKEKQKSLAVVEANMNEVIHSTVKNRKKEQKKTIKKVQTKKVAVGKGALDGFFKKA